MPSMNQAPIYLDGFSTLPLAPEAREAMLAAWSEPGNAGSAHYAGEKAARLIAEARHIIAELIGASASEIIFTSGATEANNLALLGVARAALAAGNSRRRLVISAIEHKSVIAPVLELEREGYTVTFAPVDHHGRLDLDALAMLVDDDTLLVSIMAVNNETGVIQPVAEAAAIAHGSGALFHCDAAQAFAKLPLDVLESEPDYLSLSAHKAYGPMGIGALYVAATAPRLKPLAYGGGQQAALRPGTEPVPLIAGFAAAAQVAARQMIIDQEHGTVLATRFQKQLEARQVRFHRITGPHPVVPGSITIALNGVDADGLCTFLGREVQMSTGSACSSGQIKMSHVLESMEYSEISAREVVRIFFNRYTSGEDVDRAAEAISDACLRSRLAAGEVRQ